MSNDMRTLLKRMRNANNGVFEEKKIDKKTQTNDMSMRDMLGKMRKLNEFIGGVDILTDKKEKTTTGLDIRKEEEKMQNYFNDMDNVHVQFKYLEVEEKSVFAAGQINSEIQFYFIVTPYSEDNAVEIETLDTFNSENEDNQKIIKRIESYYNIFYKYWEDNVLS